MAEVSRWHWRNTAIQAQFFFMDATVAYPLLLLLVHFRLWTLMVAITFMAILFGMSKRGFTPDACFLYIRARIGQWIGGGRRPSGAPHELTKRRYYLR